MSHAYVIEVNSRTAGIVVRDGGRFHFFASARDFNGLEGRSFNSPRDAERAARGLIGRRRGRLRDGTARPE